MDFALLDRLRADLEAADYRVSRVAALLGEQAEAARARGVLVPARRALDSREESALSTLIRLFLLGAEVPAEQINAALPSLGTDGAAELGLLEPGSGEGEAQAGLRTALSLVPVEIADATSESPLHWWIISDLDDALRRGPARPDHVMGVGGATRSLIAQAPPSRVDSALDLGTGCGIVALHLLLRAERVVATDVSDRALTFARANARLNGVDERIEFRAGDRYAPVAGERFDLILSNPPFVITPRSSDEAERYVYRDGGLTGDALAASVVEAGPAHLTGTGTLLCLANWESPWGTPGLTRVEEWLAAAHRGAGPIAAWVIERDRVDPARYAETWARDGGARPGEEAFDGLVEAWLADFAARRITAVGLGSIRISRCAASDDREPIMRIEHAAGAWATDGLGAALDAAFRAGSAADALSHDEVLASHWVLDASVREERQHVPGQEAPSAITLLIEQPIARRVSADPLLAAAVGACDGDLSLGQISDALATLLEVEASAAAEALVAGVRELAWLGAVTQSGADTAR